MTAQPILDTLAAEFSIGAPAVQSVCEMLDAGLSPVFVGRFRRAHSGALSEHQVRRLVHRRVELEELDRRRGTILRSLERQEGVGAADLEAIRVCMDRFELEDLFVPHRRPEPEVQLALDRGLGALADAIIAPVPREERAAPAAAAPAASAPAADAPAADAPAAAAGGPVAEHRATASVADAAPAADSAPAEATPANVTPADAAPEGAAAADAAPAEAASAEAAPADAAPAEAAPAEAAPAADAPPEPSTEAPATAGEAADGAGTDAVEAAPAAAETHDPDASEEPAAAEAGAAAAGSAGGHAAAHAAAHAAHAAHAAAPSPPHARVAVEEQLAMNAELSRLCERYVNPDRGVHTEAEALSGAVRILSDRMGRSAHLRGLVRRTLRKRGTLSTRQLVEAKKAGRHKPLLKLRAPLRQLQGHKLIALRQAQKERILTTVIELDLDAALPKVRAALGKHTRPAFEPLLREIALQALRDRLMPVAEADIRLELKERSDQEALRFLGAHLRQVLLTPAMGRRRAAGADVNAKGDLTLAFLDDMGHVLAHVRVEVGEKDDAALAAELAPLLDAHEPEVLALGHGKSARPMIQRLRRVLRAAGRQEGVLIVNESGAASYANGQRARQELADHPIPVRLAVTLGRRLQDPLAEILKVDPRHLGLGAEQGLVSKANARRVFDEAIESCAAHVGAELDRTPRIVLEHIPGLDAEAVERIVTRRNEGPIESREALRAEGILTEAQWTSAVAFLRVYRSPEPLDRTGLHPEQYDLARRLLEAAGGVEEALGRPGATKGLRRADHGIDEYTWRDLMRELSFPGRDPRPRVRAHELLTADVDPVRLQAGRIVEGIVTNVASFGAFLDIGLKDDAMVHISELASRYVRDARELLSIGATVRARIVDPNGSRMALSLKEIPAPERGGPRRARGGSRRRGGGRPGGGRPGGPPRAAGPAGQIYRRDGMAGAASRGRSFGGRGGPGGRDRRDDRGPRDERVDLRKINAEAEKAASHNPFANFFGKAEPEAPAAAETPKPKPKPKPKPRPAPDAASATPPPAEAGPSTEGSPPTEASPATPRPAEAPAPSDGSGEA